MSEQPTPKDPVAFLPADGPSNGSLIVPSIPTFLRKDRDRRAVLAGSTGRR
jgi:hypothetical protein